jgi:IS1 family transposase
VRANGHPSGRRWRQLHCTVCGHYFNETHGTLFHGKTHPPEVILRVIAALAEGLGIRAVGRVFDVEANTVLTWLSEAADHAEAVAAFLLTHLRVEQVQLDELFALIGELRAGQITEHDALERLGRRPRWVWTATDPVSKLLIVVSVGDRSLAMAQRVVHHVVKRLAPECWPLFLSDGFHDYATALLTHFGRWIRFSRRQPRGAAPKPRWCAHPQLQYAQVVKKYRRRRLVGLVRRVVFGCQERIAQVLARHGWQINTAFVERLNLTLRQHVAALGRRVITLAKSETGLQRQLYLFQAYFNFCLPHRSLNHDRNAITPAMAAGITDHVWRLQELLLLRVPPWPQPAQH